MNQFDWIIADSTAVILLSACGNDYSNLDKTRRKSALGQERTSIAR